MAEETEEKKPPESEEKDKEKPKNVENVQEESESSQEKSEETWENPPAESETANLVAPADISLVFIIILAGLNDFIDWLGITLNATGVWTIIVILLNIVITMMIVSIRILTDGFSITAIFGSWKNLIWLILEQIPIIGDLIPGFILFALGLKKKKT